MYKVCELPSPGIWKICGKQWGFYTMYRIIIHIWCKAIENLPNKYLRWNNGDALLKREGGALSITKNMVKDEKTSKQQLFSGVSKQWSRRGWKDEKNV